MICFRGWAQFFPQNGQHNKERVSNIFAQCSLKPSSTAASLGGKRWKNYVAKNWSRTGRSCWASPKNQAPLKFLTIGSTTHESWEQQINSAIMRRARSFFGRAIIKWSGLFRYFPPVDYPPPPVKTAAVLPVFTEYVFCESVDSAHNSQISSTFQEADCLLKLVKVNK